jgi:NADPH-dependent glutamate synthase beta subunit-like oxidoreductase
VVELQAVRVHEYPGGAGERSLGKVGAPDLTFPRKPVPQAVGSSGPGLGPIEALERAPTEQGTIRCNHQYMTGQPGISSAGDCRRGQSPEDRAIAEGRGAARPIDQ